MSTHRVNVIPTGSYRLLLCADCPWSRRAVPPLAVVFLIDYHAMFPDVEPERIDIPAELARGGPVIGL